MTPGEESPPGGRREEPRSDVTVLGPLDTFERLLELDCSDWMRRAFGALLAGGTRDARPDA